MPSNVLKRYLFITDYKLILLFHLLWTCYYLCGSNFLWRSCPQVVTLAFSVHLNLSHMVMLT